MQVLGHRGSRRPGPDNTPVAVSAALAGGADGCEIDVRRTQDAVLVCVHDPVVHGRPVVEQTLQGLSGSGVYAFADVLTGFSGAAGGRLVVEVKNDPHEPDYSSTAQSARLLVAQLSELDTAGLAARLLISSFDPVSLDVARSAGWPTGLLTRPLVSLARGLSRAEQAGDAELHAHTSVVATARAVHAVHAAGLKLVVWTVKSPLQARRLRDLGVDAVICDDPTGIVAALRT